MPQGDILRLVNAPLTKLRISSDIWLRLKGQLFQERPSVVLLSYTSTNTFAPTHGQKARRSQEKQIIITCRDIYLHRRRSRAREKERQRWAKLETWWDCDVEQQQSPLLCIFFPNFPIFSFCQLSVREN
jgi:hypothetical protein